MNKFILFKTFNIDLHTVRTLMFCQNIKNIVETTDFLYYYVGTSLVISLKHEQLLLKNCTTSKHRLVHIQMLNED